MEITLRALMTLIHGMLFGAFFLLALWGTVLGLCRSAYEEQPSRLTAKGLSLERLYLIGTVAVGWAAVLMGAYVIYPWYRALPPPGVTNPTFYPQFLLKSSATTSAWHSLGMEWKEHIAWISTIAMTMVAYVLLKYRVSIRQHPQIRAAVLVFALAGLVSAGIAGFFGAMLDKYAPVSGGPTIHFKGKSS
jgi:hypothetical protein